jgi:hypothetical protein
MDMKKKCIFFINEIQTPMVSASNTWQSKHFVYRTNSIFKKDVITQLPEIARLE